MNRVSGATVIFIIISNSSISSRQPIYRWAGRRRRKTTITHRGASAVMNCTVSAARYTRYEAYAGVWQPATRKSKIGHSSLSARWKARYARRPSAHFAYYVHVSCANSVLCFCLFPVTRRHASLALPLSGVAWSAACCRLPPRRAPVSPLGTVHQTRRLGHRGGSNT